MPKVGYVAPKEAARLNMMLDLAASDPELELDVIPFGLARHQEAALCAQHEILILNRKVPMDTLLTCGRLRFIQLMAAGYDAYDVEALHQKGILVATNASAIARSVAEHTITLMLALKRRLLENWASARSGQWDAQVKRDEITELTGSAVGIVGLGQIGREVASLLQGWNTSLLYFDVVPAAPEVERSLGLRRATLEELLRESDVVTLHVPLSGKTRRMIGEAQLRLMKASAILINTSRGPVVDEQALCRALREGQIAGAGLDVLETEPPSPENPLLSMENVVVTPHVAGSSIERVRRSIRFALMNVKRLLNGLPPLEVVSTTQG